MVRLRAHSRSLCAGKKGSEVAPRGGRAVMFFVGEGKGNGERRFHRKANNEGEAEGWNWYV